MKKVMNKINFAVLGIIMSASAWAKEINIDTVGGGDAGNGICDLLKSLQSVFNVLRILAFIGAAFYIAGWAWTYISKGEAKLEDVKKQGIGLLVGFSALLLVGIVLSFVMSASGLKVIGCDNILRTW